MSGGGDEWKSAVREEFARREAAHVRRAKHPLVEKTFDGEEIVAMCDALLSCQITMGERVFEFERRFAKVCDSPFAVMVNSGSSANLLAVAVLMNPARGRHLVAGDEVLVPSVCWSTSMWPLITYGLKPVFVDVDPKTLNLDLASARKLVTPRTKAMMLVHVLGLCTDMDATMAFAKEHDLEVLEDTCESLGSTYRGRFLGSFGSFGMFSFYYSHHITTGEGGMVLCKTQEDYDLCLCLRAHGWTRMHSQKAALEAQHPDIDPRFLFVNTGFNLRPTELAGAMGLCQLAKLETMNAARRHNYTHLVAAIKRNAKFSGQFEFTEAVEHSDPAYFGFAAMLRTDIEKHYFPFLEHLSKNSVENRPVISGNMVRQPGVKLFGIHVDPLSLPGAEEIHRRGFFIGLHIEPLTAEVIDGLADIMCSYPFA